MSVIFAYIFYFIAASASPLWRRWLGKHKNQSNTGQLKFALQVSLIPSVLSLLLLIGEPFSLKGNLLLTAFLCFVSGLTGALALFLSNTAQKYVEAGVSSLIGNVYTPITILLATIFLHEKLTLVQIFGTILLLMGVVIVSKKHKIGKFKFDKYFIMIVLSGVCIGILITCQRYLQSSLGFATGTILSWWTISLFLAIWFYFKKESHTYTKKEILITGSLKFFQDLSWGVLVFIVGNLSYVSSVTTIKVVLMFILGALLLGEKEDIKRKIFGSIVAVIGLLIMK